MAKYGETAIWVKTKYTQGSWNYDTLSFVVWRGNPIEDFKTAMSKVVVIDCRGHLLGRLASTIAKQLLEGQKIVAVRCEEVNISGRLVRQKFMYLSYLRKRTVYNPRRGHHHFRSPSKILWKTVRGMLPHKTHRGALALGRLKVFDGVPPPYDKRKRVVVPAALRVLRLHPNRRFTVLGQLSSEIGWKHGETIKKLEDKRRVKAVAWYARKKQLKKLKTQASSKATQSLQAETTLLRNSGYAL